MTTIARVAREAGVGVGTVSRVLNGSSSVSEATRLRVLEVIDQLGYEPNAAARALSTGRTSAVGVIAPFFTQPSVTQRLRGVARTVATAGHQLILFGVETPEQREAAFRTPIGRVDGLLSISLAPSEEELERLSVAGVPVVLVDRAMRDVPSVTIDDVEGGRLATRHLLDLGHARIGFVGATSDPALEFTSSSARRLGYEQALAEAGLDPWDGYVRLGPHDEGARLGRELLSLPEPPTAVFAASDLQALGVMEAAEAMGLAVPGDLSVVGFDDVEVARYAGLTTVAQPLVHSGERGAELLLDALAGTLGPDERLPLELVARSTTAEPGTSRGRSFALSGAGGTEGGRPTAQG